MDGERAVDVRVVEQALVDHVPRAAEPLFSGLEREADRAREIVSCGEDARRADEHRDVRVVTACVHGAVDRARELGAGVLGHRERVHVGAQQDRRAGFGAVQVGDHRRRRRAGADLEAQPVERGEDLRLRARQVETELRLGVDAAPEGDRVGQHGRRGLEELLHRRTLRPGPEPITDGGPERVPVLGVRRTQSITRPRRRAERFGEQGVGAEVRQHRRARFERVRRDRRRSARSGVYSRA